MRVRAFQEKLLELQMRTMQRMIREFYHFGELVMVRCFFFGTDRQDL